MLTSLPALTSLPPVSTLLAGGTRTSARVDQNTGCRVCGAIGPSTASGRSYNGGRHLFYRNICGSPGSSWTTGGGSGIGTGSLG